MINNDNPYLSVVAASRNDDHGKDLTKRTNTFIEHLSSNALKHKISIELVIVEWNQIQSNKTLGETLNLITNKYFKIKIVVVEKSIHDTFENSHKIHFFQMIAKNVGILRSSGEFILASNIDILLNQNLYNLLKKKNLKKKTIYRCNRHCIDYDYSGTLDDEYLNNLTTIIDKKYYSLDIKNNIKYYVNSSIKSIFQKRISFLKRFFLKIILNKNPKLFILNMFNKIKKDVLKLIFTPNYLKKTPNYLKKICLITIQVLNSFFQKKLFTNACGDFTLLDRASWLNIKGYIEMPIFSWHLDSIFLWEAKYQRYKFHDLSDDFFTFHINHESGGSINLQEEMFLKLKEKQIKYISNIDFFEIINELKNNSKKLKKSSWGLQNQNLKIEKYN